MGRAATRNYYDLLGVLPSTSMGELKRAFREKAKSFHPDLNPDEEAQARFRDIQEAYNILRDPVERTFYDRELGLKSNWVEEAHKESERKRAGQVAGDARSRADRAESQTRGTSRPGYRPGSSTRRTSATAGRTSTSRGPSSEPSDAPGAQAGSSDMGAGEPRASGASEARSGGIEDTDTPRSTPGDDAPRSRASAFSQQESQGGRRSRRSSRFAPGGASKAPEPPRPSEAYPPPPVVKTPWYRDRPLRIFLFATNVIATVVFFFSDPQRGVYFLVLAFGIEILYRLEDLKDNALRPPSFRPPPRK